MKFYISSLIRQFPFHLIQRTLTEGPLCVAFQKPGNGPALFYPEVLIAYADTTQRQNYMFVTVIFPFYFGVCICSAQIKQVCINFSAVQGLDTIKRPTCLFHVKCDFLQFAFFFKYVSSC